MTAMWGMPTSAENLFTKTGKLVAQHWAEAKAPQRPLPDGALKVVATGSKQDGPGGDVQGVLL